MMLIVSVCRIITARCSRHVVHVIECCYSSMLGDSPGAANNRGENSIF